VLRVGSQWPYTAWKVDFLIKVLALNPKLELARRIASVRSNLKRRNDHRAHQPRLLLSLRLRRLDQRHRSK
jgi:hypothetical protein